MEIKIRLQPKQQLLWYLLDQSEVTRIGSGGSRGGAKSGGGRRCMIRRRLKYSHFPGLILRRTFPELQKSHIAKIHEEFPELSGMYNEQRHEIAFPNGSILYFGSADNEKRISQFYSSEMGDIMVDEAQEFSQRELEKLSGSNRCTSNASVIPKMLYTFMPGISETGLPPIGLQYLKRVLVDGNLRPEERLKKWAFVPARAWDNIKWVEKELNELGIGVDVAHTDAAPCGCQECLFYSWSEDQRMEFFLRSEYGTTLAAMASDKGLREAWIYGTFGSFQGQYFQNWDPAKHVISREEAQARIKPWHKSWACGDWGFDHPHAFYRLAQDERGKVRVYGELWGRQLNETDLGKKIGAEWHGASLQAFPISWDAGKLSKRASPKFPRSIQDMIGDAMPQGMLRPHPADSSPGSRIAGARLLALLLDSGMIEICEDCPRLIECLPTLLRDPDNPEDVLKVDYSENYIGDDPFDAVRMGVQHMLGAAMAPQIVDQTQVMQNARRQTSMDSKVNRAIGRFDKTFGKDPNENEWFPKA